MEICFQQNNTHALMNNMLSENTINKFLEKLSWNLKSAKDKIIQANNEDIQTAKEKDKDNAFIERLTVS